MLPILPAPPYADLIFSMDPPESAAEIQEALDKIQNVYKKFSLPVPFPFTSLDHEKWLAFCSPYRERVQSLKQLKEADLLREFLKLQSQVILTQAMQKVCRIARISERKILQISDLLPFKGQIDPQHNGTFQRFATELCDRLNPYLGRKENEKRPLKFANIHGAQEVHVQFDTSAARLKNVNITLIKDPIGRGTHKQVYQAASLVLMRERGKFFEPFKPYYSSDVFARVAEKSSTELVYKGLVAFSSIWSTLKPEDRQFFVPPPHSMCKSGALLEFTEPFYCRETLHEAILHGFIYEDRQHTKTHPLTLNEKLSLIRDALTALIKTHKLGFIHGDASPANFIIDKGTNGYFSLLHDWDMCRKEGIGLDLGFSYINAIFYQRNLVSFEADGFPICVALFLLAANKDAFPFCNNRSRILTDDLTALIIAKQMDALQGRLPAEWDQKLKAITSEARATLLDIANQYKVDILGLKLCSLHGIHDTINLMKEKLRLQNIAFDITSVISITWKALERALAKIPPHIPITRWPSPLSDMGAIANYFQDIKIILARAGFELKELDNVIVEAAAAVRCVLISLEAKDITIDLLPSSLEQISEVGRFMFQSNRVNDARLLTFANDAKLRFWTLYKDMVDNKVTLPIPLKQLQVIEEMMQLMKEAVQVDKLIVTAMRTDEEFFSATRTDDENELNRQVALFFQRRRIEINRTWGRNCLDAVQLRSLIEKWLLET